MWPFFFVGGAVILGGWLWGASKVATKAPPFANNSGPSFPQSIPVFPSMPPLFAVGEIVFVDLFKAKLAPPGFSSSMRVDSLFVTNDPNQEFMLASFPNNAFPNHPELALSGQRIIPRNSAFSQRATPGGPSINF